jgi:hypothetical protein
MDPNNPQRLFTSNNVLWRTSNAAGSWDQASASITGLPARTWGIVLELRRRPGNSNLLVAGTDFGRSVASPTPRPRPAPPRCRIARPPPAAVRLRRGLRPAELAPRLRHHFLVRLGHVWRSIDSGVSWSNIDGSGVNGLPDVPAHSVAVSPFGSMTIYVGTDIGVFVTTDGGASWARENTGFANVITDHLVFSPVDSSNARLFAFTHGRGAFRTTVSTSLAAARPVHRQERRDHHGQRRQQPELHHHRHESRERRGRQRVGRGLVPRAGLTCTWTCAASAGGSCAASGSGNIMQGVTIGPLGTVTFTAPCTVSAGASGSLANTATVTYAGDPASGNNTAADTDTVVPHGRPRHHQTNGVTAVGPATR